MNTTATASTDYRTHSANLGTLAALAGVLLGAASLAACGPGSGADEVDGGASGGPDASVGMIDNGVGVDAKVAGPTDGGPPRPPADKTCTAGAQCASGFCVDGVCCDRACDGSCESCALTGKVGTCSPIKNAADDSCGGDSYCDVTGACRKLLGKACLFSGECASGNCLDGVCCGSAACGTCQSCAVPGSEGTCAVVAKFTDDPRCSAEQTCDGLGMCRSKNGTACSEDAACTSLNCIDGICCNVACAGAGAGVGTCYSCMQAGSVGTCTEVRCKFNDGEPCASNADCLGGSCITSYRDGEGDGYGAGKVTRCELAPAAGYVLKGGDCCDSDPGTHPGASSYAAAANACGGFDRNCDGKVERADGSTMACGCVGPVIGKIGGGQNLHDLPVRLRAMETNRTGGRNMMVFGHKTTLRAWGGVAAALIGALTLAGCPTRERAGDINAGDAVAPDVSGTGNGQGTGGGGGAMPTASNGGSAAQGGTSGGGSQRPDGGAMSEDGGIEDAAAEPDVHRCCSVRERVLRRRCLL